MKNVPCRMFWKITIQLTLKICGLNSDVNDSLLLSYMFSYICIRIFPFWRYQFAVFKDMGLCEICNCKNV